MPTSSVPTDPQPPTYLDCPSELEIDIDPRVAHPDSVDGITVSPTQVPTSWNNAAPSELDFDPSPDTWDRSAVPAGACVFRLIGVDGACYPRGGTFFTGSCSALHARGNTPTPAPGSYYDTSTACSERPGCPSADGNANAPGYWWYFYQSGVYPDQRVPFTDLVICAPECANSFAEGGGCLRLKPNVSECD